MNAIFQPLFLIHEYSNMSPVFSSHPHSGYWPRYIHPTVAYVTNERKLCHYYRHSLLGKVHWVFKCNFNPQRMRVHAQKQDFGPRHAKNVNIHHPWDWSFCHRYFHLCLEMFATWTEMEIFNRQHMGTYSKSTTVSSTFLNSNYFCNYNVNK